MSQPVSASRVRDLFAQARAQYELYPSDYGEGVLTGLGQLLEDISLQTVLREDVQQAHAAERPAVARVRDFYKGLNAALMWAVGELDAPPDLVLPTESTEDSDPDIR